VTRRFDWDPGKAASNFRKHGIHFQDAIDVFDDPFAISLQDRIVDGEQRWQTVGAVEGSLLLLVAHLLLEEDEEGVHVEVVRVISARPVTRKERRRYEENS
jgi:uncharacterized DUF497 family protein